MPLAKPSSRRKVSSASSLGESSVSSRTYSPVPRYHRVTKVPLAVSVAAFLVVVAVIIGTMAASSMQRDDEMLRAELERVQQNLSDRVSRLEQAALPAAQPTAPVPKPVSNTALPVTVTATQLNGMHAVVDATKWNKSAATQTVEYRDTEHGVLLKLPYNPQWGNEMYKVAPYEVEGGVLWFGPLMVDPLNVGDTRFSRMYKLEIGPKMSYQDVFKKYATENPRPAPYQPIKQRDLAAGNLTAEVYTIPEREMIGTAEYVVFSGKKFNYTLSTFSNNTKLTSQDLAVFSNVIVSLRAI